MAKGILSKDVVLQYSATSMGEFAAIPGMFEFPDLGATPEMIDVTSLSDGNFTYIPGIKDYGSLDFSFIYSGDGNESNFKKVKDAEGKSGFWKVIIPGATPEQNITYSFSGEPTAYMTGTGVNSRLEFVVSIALDSDINVEFPLAA